MTNQIKFFFILFVSGLCLGFTACGDDDDTNYAEAIAGTYEGTLDIAALGVTIPNVELKLTRQSDKIVQISIDQEVMPGLEIKIETPSKKITLSKDVYSISATTSYNLQAGVSLPMAPPTPGTGTIIVKYSSPIALSITVNGTITSKGKANLDINVSAGGGYPPFPFDVNYEGQKK
jgi:hypothetical protein